MAISTLDEFAAAIEDNLRRMMQEQNRLIEEAVEAKLEPHHVVGILQAIAAKVERETAAS